LERHAGDYSVLFKAIWLRNAETLRRSVQRETALSATRGTKRGNPTRPHGARFTRYVTTEFIFWDLLMKAELPRLKKRKKNGAARWALHVFLLTLLLSGGMTFASASTMDVAPLWAALIVLVVLIGLGVFSDMLGVAITSADRAPFVAMASKRVKGAKMSLHILQNAERYASICNDVIGDICGIVSGSAGAAIAGLLAMRNGLLTSVLWVVVTSAGISALTVSLKAIGKTIAMNNNRRLVHMMGSFFSFFSR
jgi:hypothetical protein